MEDFLNFKKMLTPMFIKILFWIGLVITVLAGLGMIISGANQNYGGGGTVLIGLITLVVGPVLVRVYCEILIVVFSINDTLTEIKNAVKPKEVIAHVAQVQ